MSDIEIPEIPSAPYAEYTRVVRLSIDEIKSKNEHQENSDVDDHEHKHKKDLEFGKKDDNNDKQKVQEPHGEDPNAPQDKGHFVLVIICLFGLVHMLPITFLYNAMEYWLYKLRDTTSNSTDPKDRTFLQANFASIMTIFITVTGVVCTLIGAVVGHKLHPQMRVFGVLFIHTCIFIVMSVFTKVDTDDWQLAFFAVTILLQVLMAGAMSLGVSGSMGLISRLPPRYLKAQLVGEGVSGIFTAVLMLISIVVTPSVLDSALMYFTTGATLMGGTSILFYIATQSKYFKYYTKNVKEERKEKIRNIGDFKAVLKILWPMLILSVIPLTVPVPTNLVASEFKGDGSPWGEKYFLTICTYLIPALTGVVGRSLYNYIDFDCSIPMLYLIVISKAAIFDALLFLSNAQPRQHLPVLLTHDWQYGLVMACSSFTSGFVANLTSLKTMRMVPKNRIELSMMCSMFFVSLCAAALSPLSMVAVKIL